MADIDQKSIEQARLGLLDNLPLLEGLDPAERERLLRHAEVRSYPRGNILFEEGGPADCLFVLLNGGVELFTSTPRRDAAILILWPSEVFMAAAALYDEPFLLSARALTDVTLLRLDARQVRQEVAHSAQLAERMTRILAGQFRLVVRHIKDLKLRSGPKRLAAFLLRLVIETGKNGFADLPIPKAVLASRLGLSPETLSRALQTLRSHGVTVRGSRVILTDRKKLEQFCCLNPLIDGRELKLPVAAL